MYEALREYRSCGLAGGLVGQRAQARLYTVLYTVLHSWARRDSRLLEPEDIVQSIIAEIFQKVGKCNALDYSELDRSIAGTLAWVRTIYQNRRTDWLRRQERRVVVQGEVHDASSTEFNEAGVVEKLAAQQAEWDMLAAQRLAADRSRSAVRRLIQTGRPPAYFEEAKKLGVGLSLEMLDLQLHAFEQVRLKGTPTYDVGVEMGEQGGRKTIQDRVSKRVERGKHALWLGARLAREEEKEPTVRSELDKLVLFLTGPLRRSKS